MWGRCPASLSTAALGKDSWSQPGRLDGPTVRQTSGNWTPGQFQCSSMANLGAQSRPSSPVLIVRKRMPQRGQTREQAALPSGATKGLMAGVGTVAPQNKRFKLMLF